MDEPCSVYLIENASGDLIYVGITSRGHIRQAEHLATKEWGAEVATTRWEHFPSRIEAAAREHALIREHAPKHNISKNARHGMTADPAAIDELETKIKMLGARRTTARQALKQASEDLPPVLREAHQLGLAKMHLAKLAQISRVTLDAMLNE